MELFAEFVGVFFYVYSGVGATMSFNLTSLAGQAGYGSLLNIALAYGFGESRRDRQLRLLKRIICRHRLWHLVHGQHLWRSPESRLYPRLCNVQGLPLAQGPDVHMRPDRRRVRRCPHGLRPVPADREGSPPPSRICRQSRDQLHSCRACWSARHLHPTRCQSWPHLPQRDHVHHLHRRPCLQCA